MSEIESPFDVTKAVDFTDAQIAATWVDLPGDGGFFHLADPRSPMPLLLLGGKGSGRTHLMRYFSYPLQKLRAGSEQVASYLREQGYVGVYMRCEGLNAGRFEGKGQSVEAWAGIFSYYMDLWLAQIALQTLSDAFSGTAELANAEQAIVRGIRNLFDMEVDLKRETLEEVVDLFTRLRREVDVAVNNAALSRNLDGLRIRATRGRLVFGLPKLFATNLRSLQGVQIVYLIDELENLTESQQEYVNTIIREKEPPCTFKVGARLYGFRTQRTLSAGEENRRGSEYEQVVLDEQLRVDARYDDFARELVAQRLRRAGYLTTETEGVKLHRALDALFEEFPASKYEREQTRFVEENYAPEQRPYFKELRRQLLEAMPRRLAPGVSANDDVDSIIHALQCRDFPLLEKVNIFLLYQDWASEQNLVDAAQAIGDACRGLLADTGGERHKQALSHFKADLLAQLLRDCRQRQRYFGLQTFIDMSSGLPRHLLIVLKFVHRWALFHGERPFQGVPLSMTAQRVGVTQAANWFFEDARAAGPHAETVQASIERLAKFLHQLRYSDKPVESSLTTFSLNEAEASQEVRQTIEHARDASLLLRVISGAKDRNEEGVVAKYQLNPMLCPRFDLPLSRRGFVALSVKEAEAIFGADSERFDEIVGERLWRMNAPFKRSRARTKGSHSGGNQGQGHLPGFE